MSRYNLSLRTVSQLHILYIIYYNTYIKVTIPYTKHLCPLLIIETSFSWKKIT